MRRSLFFIVAIVFAATSFASIPDRAREDASELFAPLPETRVWASDVLAPWERPATIELSRALHQAYADSSTTNASGLRCFLSVDPARGSVDRRIPQSWNRYSYALNNPVRYTDPDGRCVSAIPCPAWLVVGTETVATQVGSRAAAGAAAGPVGVAIAGAGITGWQIGRGIGTSTIGGRTIDSRVSDVFLRGIELTISLSENTQHGDESANDPDRAVDRDKVKANGDVYVDTETGAIVYVHGGQVVLENEAGQLISQWNDQTPKETKKKEKDGKWRKKPKDQDEPEIE